MNSECHGCVKELESNDIGGGGGWLMTVVTVVGYLVM